MKGSQRIADHGLDPIKYVAFATGTTTYQMKPTDRIVRASGAAVAGTVYLPPLSETPILQLYFIQATSVATGNVTIAPFIGGQATPDAVLRESESLTLAGGTAASEVLTATNAWLIVCSVGNGWITVADDLDAA